MLVQGFVDFGKVEGFNSGAARSRSTSAGRSSQSDGQSSLDLQQKVVSPPLSPPPVYATDALGLPEYDYPTHWSIQQALPLPEIDYPMPFIVKNTFVGFDVCRPQSLEEFYTERQTKSCPASGIGLPPGLEDMVLPEEATARLVAAGAVLRCEMPGTQATYHLPDGLFDAAQIVPQRHAVGDFSGRSQVASLSPTLEAAQPLTLLLDSLLSSQTGPQASPSQPQLGAPDCPTFGSQGHKFGTCKPCAFLYTKGCGNGVLCPFCHLCDAGEKKRRQKDKHAAIKQARQWGR